MKPKNILTDELIKVLPSNENIKRGVNNIKQASNPEWQKKQKEGIKKKVQTQEWKINQLHGTRTIRANGTWKENVKKGALKREQENTFDRKALNKQLSKTKKWQDSIKKGMKERWNKPKNLTTCQHCGKTYDNANFKKWHGDNCKQLFK